jgi:hypothetical protein
MFPDMAESATPVLGRPPLRARSANDEACAADVFLTPAKPVPGSALRSHLRQTPGPRSPSEEASLLRTVSRVLRDHLQSVEKASREGCAC